MDSVLITQDDAILALEEANIELAQNEVNTVLPTQLGVDPSQIVISYEQEVWRPIWPRYVMVPAQVNLGDLLASTAKIAASTCVGAMLDSIHDVFGEDGLNQFLSQLLNNSES